MGILPMRRIYRQKRDVCATRSGLSRVILAKSQSRPAVYIEKTADPKKLEPVKYTGEGDYYAVHRVLDGSERLYLKLGDDTSEIRRR